MKRFEYRFFYIFTSQQSYFQNNQTTNANPISQRMNTGEILIYQTQEGKVKLTVTYKEDNFWLSQKLIAQLFDCSTDNVSLHLKNIFASGELSLDSVTEEFSATANDGKNYKTKFYKLDVIISVGYCVKSHNMSN